MLNILLIAFGKTISKIIKFFNLGDGTTWPGHIALGINKNFIHEMLSKSSLQVILIAGTNGKTTTAKLIRTALEENGKRVIQNQSGANLLNGIASTLLLQSDLSGKLRYDFAIFEVDENILPLALKELQPRYLLLLNLFRDQLDRYGEVDEIARKWGKALELLSIETILILNADDPLIAYLGNKVKMKVFYFGLDKKSSGTKLEHAADSIYCPACGTKLTYTIIYYSHLGVWQCTSCGLCRPTKNLLCEFPFYPLSGAYNASNTLAAVAVLKQVGLDDKKIIEGLKKFEPAFGRQEKILYKGRNIQIFLSKNPTGFNESMRTVEQSGAKTVLLILNDRIADGRDVSWIWDIDFPMFNNILIAGDRAYDMGLRVKYGTEDQRSKIKDQNHSSKFKIYEKLNVAIDEALRQVDVNETFYILPTYTAMLEVRKILTGKSIL
jgi:UDP-N-acetylmuramyl tripeptide synthase